jgi:hypothetical protein
MTDIAQLDHAWEAVNALGSAGQEALRAIEELGGKDPRQRVRDAAERMLGELKRLYEASRDQITANVIAEADPGFKPVGACQLARVERDPLISPKASGSRTIGDLLSALKGDPASNYRRAKYGTRRTYDSHLRTIDRDIGGLAVGAVTPKDYRGWHRQWVANGRVSMAHGLVGMVKQLFGYGLGSARR